MPAAQVQTVTGRVPADELGFTLPHEHTAITLWGIRNRWDYWELTADEPIVATELEAFRALGGSCLVDLTLPGVGRDPRWLRRLAERTGLRIVMGAGWYREAYYPPEALIDRRSVESLADELVREFHEGVGETGIRPGILGEIGTDKPWVSAQEERVFRAVARASRATGMAVTTHAVMSDVGLAQLRTLEGAGVDPGRVVIGHADRVLLSQDVCHNSQLKPYGGNGYVYLQETFLPRLRGAGVPEATIQRLTVDNPRRVLALAV